MVKLSPQGTLKTVRPQFTHRPIGHYFDTSMISLLLGILFVGVILWVITTYIPMSPVIKNILVGVVVILVIVAVLKFFGLWAGVVHVFGR